MATRGRPHLSPGSKFRALEERKEKQKTYERSLKVMRVSPQVLTRWEVVKTREKLKSNDSVACYLLDLWEKAQTVMQQDAPVTPLKKPETSQSTPLTEGPVPPSFPVSDISDSNGGSDHNRRTDESIVTKYSERAEQTDKSFVNISFEIFEDEKETSYQPSSSVESEDEDEDLDDFDEKEVEDYILDMSLQLEPENTGVPIRSIANRIFHVDDGVDDDADMEEGDDSVLQEERNYVAEKRPSVLNRTCSI